MSRGCLATARARASAGIMIGRAGPVLVTRSSYVFIDRRYGSRPRFGSLMWRWETRRVRTRRPRGDHVPDRQAVPPDPRGRRPRRGRRLVRRRLLGATLLPRLREAGG